MRSAFVYITILFLTACGSGHHRNPVAERDEEQLVREESQTVEEDTDDPYRGLYEWQGNLDGKYPVIMWYKEVDSMLTGTLFYTAQKNAKPIKLIGEIQHGEHCLTEFLPDGTITGTWYMIPTRHSIEGMWASNGRNYSASLMEIDTAVSISDHTELKDVSGEYRYGYENDGPTGGMTVVQLPGNKVVLNMESMTEGPAYNMASIDNDTLQLVGYTAVHSSSEYGVCQFSVHFYNGFAKVDYIDGKEDCGFGFRAKVDGVYLKVK